MSSDLLRTALLIPVEAAEPLVGHWRRQFDPSAAHGVPPHITLIFPFLPSGRCNADVRATLRDMLQCVPPFSFQIPGVGSFPGILYLAPSPAEPFIDLIRLLAGQFPDAPPYGGAFPTIIPHLTVAHTEDAALRARIIEELMPQLPLACAAEEALLMRENVDGQWQLAASFPFGGGRALR